MLKVRYRIEIYHFGYRFRWTIWFWLHPASASSDSQLLFKGSLPKAIKCRLRSLTATAKAKSCFDFCLRVGIHVYIYSEREYAVSVPKEILDSKIPRRDVLIIQFKVVPRAEVLITQENSIKQSRPTHSRRPLRNLEYMILKGLPARGAR